MTISGEATIDAPAPKSGIEIIGPVVPGSLIMIPVATWEHLTQAENFDTDPDEAERVRAQAMLAQVAQAVGHKDFLFVVFDPMGGTPAVLGPDEAKTALEALITTMAADALDKLLEVTPNPSRPCGITDRHAEHSWSNANSSYQCSGHSGRPMTLDEAITKPLSQCPDRSLHGAHIRHIDDTDYWCQGVR